MKRTALFGLLVACVLSGCLWVPGPRGTGVLVVPPLPAVVELDAEPYYFYSGYYYYYQNDRWSYGQSRRGPWLELPRDHYPREVRWRGRGQGQGQGEERGRGMERGRDRD